MAMVNISSSSDPLILMIYIFRLVAFYDEDKLICSGTLISTKEVIVAGYFEHLN